MPIEDPKEFELTELQLNELSLNETWESLQRGETIVVANYEETRNKDVLVRLDKRRYTVTQISFDVDPIEYGQRYWTIHNVSINALSLHKVYPYVESLYSIKHRYSPEAIVYFDDGVLPRQIAVVEKVFVATTGEIYYTLMNEEGYYHELELFDSASL